MIMDIKEKIESLLQEWEDVNIDMKFPEATAWNILCEYQEDLFSNSHEGDALIGLAIEVLENSALRKGAKIPIGKDDANGNPLFEGDEVKLILAIWQDIPHLVKSRFRIVRIEDAWYFDPIELHPDGFAEQFTGVRNIVIDENGDTILVEGPPIKQPTHKFSSWVIFKIE
jgi:hypothetical protein